MRAEDRATHRGIAQAEVALAEAEARLAEALAGNQQVSRQDLLTHLRNLARDFHDFKNLWLAARHLIINEKLNLVARPDDRSTKEEDNHER